MASRENADSLRPRRNLRIARAELERAEPAALDGIRLTSEVSDWHLTFCLLKTAAYAGASSNVPEIAVAAASALTGAADALGGIGAWIEATAGIAGLVKCSEKRY